MAKKMGRAVEIIDGAVRAIGQATAWAALGLVALVAFNVLARYLFSAGTVALQELEWHVLAVTALIGVSYGVNQGEEVRVDMLYAHYGPRLKAAVDLLSAVLMLLVSIAIFRLSLKYVAQSHALMEGSPDPGGLPYRYLLKSFIPIGFALLALQSIVSIARAAAALIAGGRDGD